MDKISSYFIQQCVLGFGFLNGLWINVGVDPEGTIAQALASSIQQLSSNPVDSLVFWLIFLILTIVTIVSSWLLAYSIGGFLGIIAVLAAFIGGACITSSFGVYLLLAGIVLGFFAPMTQGE